MVARAKLLERELTREITGGFYDVYTPRLWLPGSGLCERFGRSFAQSNGLFALIRAIRMIRVPAALSVQQHSPLQTLKT